MSTYHVAACLNETCDGSGWWLDAETRDQWAVRHEEDTGHEVGIRTEEISSEHIRVAEPAPPVWEYRIVLGIDALKDAAREGWRLHTALPFPTHVQFVRRRP